MFLPSFDFSRHDESNDVNSSMKISSRVLQISLQTFGTTGNGSLFPLVSAFFFIPIEFHLQNFRSGGYGECLLDRPTIDLLEAHRNSKRLPGENFDENKQCEFVFGNGSRICPYMVTKKIRLKIPSFCPCSAQFIRNRTRPHCRK